MLAAGHHVVQREVLGALAAVLARVVVAQENLFLGQPAGRERPLTRYTSRMIDGASSAALKVRTRASSERCSSNSALPLATSTIARRTVHTFTGT